MSRYDRVETLQSAVDTVGNGEPLDTATKSAAGVQIVGAGTYTVTFQASVDGTNYVSLVGRSVTTVTTGTTATGAGVWVFPVAGMHSMRARVSAYTSGEITVKGRATDAGQGVVD